MRNWEGASCIIFSLKNLNVEVLRLVTKIKSDFEELGR